MNPNAIVFWLFGAGLGYLLGDGRGAIIGGVVCLGISVLAALIPDRRRRW